MAQGGIKGIAQRDPRSPQQQHFPGNKSFEIEQEPVKLRIQ
jgi:hypothetical protein